MKFYVKIDAASFLLLLCSTGAGRLGSLSPKLLLSNRQGRFYLIYTVTMKYFMTMKPTRMDDRPDRRGPGDGHGETGVLTRTRLRTQKPSMYKVLLLNDDFTPMDFVVHVLERFFSKTQEEAAEIMMQVHRKGVGVCGVYTYEVAETKVGQVMDFARRHEHPLQCTLEKE